MQQLGKRKAKPEDSLQTVRDYVEQLSRLPLLYGQHVEGVILSGKSRVVIRHSLGRGYLAGILVGQDIPIPTPLVVLFPEQAEKAMGLDITQYVVVAGATPVPTDIYVRAWIY
jgi:hypothetical protein